jgi:hypothetical protein
MSPNDFDEPIDQASYAWPTAELDPIIKMRAIAASLPHVGSDETVFDIPFDRFWPSLVDFEANTPRIEGTVSRVRILERNGENARLEVRSALGFWNEFEVIERPGWCLMQAKVGQIGMAARPEGPGRTRYFHFEGSQLLGRLARPFFAWNVRQDFRRIRTLLPST